MADVDPLSPEQLLLQRRFIGALARSMVADTALVDDVAQETWLELLSTRSRPRATSARAADGSPPRSWLRQVVRNVVRQLGRAEGRRAARESAVAHGAETRAPATDRIAEQLELQRRLIERVLALPPLHREIVLLHFYEERTVAQAAAQLAIPLETARTRLRRALDELRASWNGVLGGERAGLLALAQLAVSTGGAGWGTWFVMAKASKWAIAAALALLLGGGAWLWPTAHRPPVQTPTVARADVSSAAAESASAVSAERVEEPTAAAAPVASPKPAADDFGSVKVHVTWLRTTTPIPGVPVSLTLEERPPSFVDEVQGVTDGHGDWLATHVPTGSVLAVAAGFLAFSTDNWKLTLHERDGVRRIDVRAGETTDVDLSVWKECEVDGSVVDSKGRPIPGATIWISNEPSWPSLGQEFGKSDASGRFHLPVVEQVHHMSAFAPGFAPSPAIWYGSRVKDQHVDVVLELTDAGGCIRGRVVDAAARPVDHAFVYVAGPWGDVRVLRDGTYGQQPPARTTRTSADGTFVVDGAPVGEVSLVVRARGFAPQRRTVVVTADAPTDLDVALRAGGALAGTLLDREGEPIAGTLVRVDAANSNALAEPRREILTAYARTDEAGDFVVDHLGDGPLEASVDAGAAGTAKLAFSVAEGEVHEWSPELSTGLSIRGTIVDEDDFPLWKWRVEARPEEYEQAVEPSPRVATDVDGHFVIERRLDRLYSLFVFERSAHEYDDAAFTVKTIHGVRPGADEVKIQIPKEMRASAFVTGRVRDADGAPVPMAALYLCDAKGTASIGFNVGDVDGFRLGPFPPGAYDVRLSAEGLPERELGEQTLAAGATLDLGALTLEHSGYAEIRVTRSDGRSPKERDLSIWSEARQNSEHVSSVGEVFRSAPLAPGRYELCTGPSLASIWIPFEVVAGKTTEVSATLEPGWIRSFRLVDAAGARPVMPVHVTVADASGRALWSRDWPTSPNGPYVVAQRFARGEFVISFTAADGAKGESRFSVTEEADEKAPIDVTLR